MKPSRENESARHAFTLIELLIVIAIIAILALIAVPNFLEAQTRAKVSRAMADQNAYDTAMETYMMDNGSYIQSCSPDMTLVQKAGANPAEVRATWPNMSRLTTPISYITSISFDPFSTPATDSWSGGQGLNPFHIYTGNGIQWSNTQAYWDAPRIMFMIMSVGPDKDFDMVIDVTHTDRFMLYDYFAKTNQGGQSCYGMPYDPTNGTVSAGDIYRFGQGKVLKAFSGMDYTNYQW